MTYCGLRRANIPPAIYNERRIGELPIPNTDIPAPLEGVFIEEVQVKKEFVMDEADVNLFENILNEHENDDSVLEISTISNADQFDIPDGQNTPLPTINVQCGIQSPSRHDLEQAGPSKPKKKVQKNHSLGHHFHLDDDVVFYEPEGGKMPRPIQATDDGMVKQEKDIVSGEIPFNVKVSAMIYIHEQG